MMTETDSNESSPMMSDSIDLIIEEEKEEMEPNQSQRPESPRKPPSTTRDLRQEFASDAKPSTVRFRDTIVEHESEHPLVVDFVDEDEDEEYGGQPTTRRHRESTGNSPMKKPSRPARKSHFNIAANLANSRPRKSKAPAPRPSSARVDSERSNRSNNSYASSLFQPSLWFQPAADIQDEDVAEEYELEEDVYSMLFVHGYSCNASSMYAMLVIVWQLAMISLLFYDLLKGRTDLNRLNIPITVETQVRVAQFLSMPLAVMIHQDCTEALYMLRIPYDPLVQKISSLATQRAWLMTLFLRFTVGFLLVYVSFIQIMQADNITDLFLDLESVVFVGSIDNISFWLAEKGFLKKELQQAA
jgi:hypothetical protein